MNVEITVNGEVIHGVVLAHYQNFMILSTDKGIMELHHTEFNFNYVWV